MFAIWLRWFRIHWPSVCVDYPNFQRRWLEEYYRNHVNLTFVRVHVSVAPSQFFRNSELFLTLRHRRLRGYPVVAVFSPVARGQGKINGRGISRLPDISPVKLRTADYDFGGLACAWCCGGAWRCCNCCCCCACFCASCCVCCWCCCSTCCVLVSLAFC